MHLNKCSGVIAAAFVVAVGVNHPTHLTQPPHMRAPRTAAAAILAAARALLLNTNPHHRHLDDYPAATAVGTSSSPMAHPPSCCQGRQRPFVVAAGVLFSNTNPPPATALAVAMVVATPIHVHKRKKSLQPTVILKKKALSLYVSSHHLYPP